MGSLTRVMEGSAILMLSFIEHVVFESMLPSLACTLANEDQTLKSASQGCLYYFVPGVLFDVFCFTT